MLDIFQNYTSNPALLFLGLIVIAWVWEDATVICGALLAADGLMSVSLAVLGVFIGISSGDLALFYLGRLALRFRRLRAWVLMNPKSRGLRRKFRRRIFSNILIIRFVPGLRTLGFTLCGLWGISLRHFLAAMTTAGVIWIAIVFTAIYHLGASEWLENSPWKWSLMIVALFLFVVNNFWSSRRLADRV